MVKKHEKHTKLKKPAIGFYGRNELAFVGAPCGLIQKYVERLILSFGDTKNVVYVDTDHGAKEGDIAFATFQDKISHKRFEKKEVNDFDQKFLLNDQDLIFANGNHFQANKQVVFIHPEKGETIVRWPIGTFHIGLYFLVINNFSHITYPIFVCPKTKFLQNIFYTFTIFVFSNYICMQYAFIMVIILL